MRYALILSLTLAACGGGGSSIGSDPSRLTPALVNGVWNLNVTGCLSDNLAVRLQASEDGSLTSAINTWGSSQTIHRPLDGEINLATGAAEFHMWASGARTHAMLFTGTLTADGTLSGSVMDPMPGYAPIFHFSGSPDCTAQASGQRR